MHRGGFILAASVGVVVLIVSGLGGAVDGAVPPVSRIFLSANGSDSGSCTLAAPCQTFDRAYKVAKRGQLVELAPGVYPAQSIGADVTKVAGSGVVTFAPPAGASVSAGFTTVQAGVSHVAFERIGFPEGWEVGPGDGGEPATDVTFTRTKGASFFIMNARDVRVLGGEYGPSIDTHPQIKVYNLSNTYAPTNILIDGVYFHDFTRSGPDVHTECLQIYAGAGVVVRKNRFRNCDGTGSLVFGQGSGAPLRDVLVENNMFESGDGVDEPSYDVQASLCLQNLVFRQNTFVKGIVLYPCAGYPNGTAAVVSNYGPTQRWNVCGRANVRYSHNVWVGGTAGKCAASDIRVQKLQVVSPSDLHLIKGANAIDKGDPKEYPRKDIDGDKRPGGKGPDAGADERPPPLKKPKP